MSMIVVTGSRDFRDEALVHRVLDDMAKGFADHVFLLHGMCPTGVDRFAETWYEQRIGTAWQVCCTRFPADWDKYGPSAGPRRNQAMVNHARTFYDMNDKVKVIAFPGGKGTRDCWQRAKRAGLPRMRVRIARDGHVSLHGYPGTDRPTANEGAP